MTTSTVLKGRSQVSTYPKEFFGECTIEKERKRVFVIMPFGQRHSKDLYESIALVCKRYGLDAWRADRTAEINIVKRDILDNLAKADIIIADITGGNANVFYELGLAHMLFECKNVISLVSRRDERPVPSDIQDIRYMEFDVSTPNGQNTFEAELGRLLANLRSAPPGIINSAMDRTKRLIADMEELGKLDPSAIGREAVRFSGGLSAFAISEDEEWPCPPSQKRYYQEYNEWLMREKKALVELARMGCPVYCMITPPSAPFKERKRQYLNSRKATLLSFLRGKDGMLKNKEKEALLNSIWFAVSPFRQKNQYIIGHVSYVEGYKDVVQRGFPLSLRQTGRSAIEANIEMYDALFPKMAAYTMKKYGGGRGSRNKYTAEDLRHATIKCLEQQGKH
jgi:hypothetical protein